MGKLRETALILGEGPTEFFYFKSLCDVFKIEEGVAMGYSHIFCIIDMASDHQARLSEAYQPQGT